MFVDYGALYQEAQAMPDDKVAGFLLSKESQYVEMMASFFGDSNEVALQMLRDNDVAHKAWKASPPDMLDANAVFNHYSTEGKAWVYEHAGIEFNAVKMHQCRMAIESFKKYLAPGSVILNYGGGAGSEALAVASAGFKVINADVEGPICDFFEARVKGLNMQDKITCFRVKTQDNGKSLPGPFHGVFSCSTLEHVPDPESALKGVYEHCSDGAVLALQYHFNQRPDRAHKGPILWPAHFETCPNHKVNLRGGHFKSFLISTLKLTSVNEFMSLVKCFVKNPLLVQQPLIKEFQDSRAKVKV